MTAELNRNKARPKLAHISLDRDLYRETCVDVGIDPLPPYVESDRSLSVELLRAGPGSGVVTAPVRLTSRGQTWCDVAAGLFCLLALLALFAVMSP